MSKTAKNIENCPLVSIIVITYNSSKYVIETLDSAYQQTYQNIELIISDDGSTDITVQICKEWLEKHKQRFVRTEIITVSQNTGIPANCNRGVKLSKGEWIKLIAGDDLLIPTAIEINVQFIIENKTNFLFSKLLYINAKSEIIDRTIKNENTIEFFNGNSKKQYRMLLIGNAYVPAASSFINKDTLIKLGGFDENIPMCEDYPLWIKATKKEYKLYFHNKETVYYRVYQNSVMGSKSIKYHRSMKKIFFKYRFKELVLVHPYLALEELIWNLFRTNMKINKYIRCFLPSTYFYKIKNF